MPDHERLPYRVYLLTLGTFAIGTDGFVIAGVLRDIANGTRVSVAAAGQLVTLFAWVYALASPLMAALLARLPRRRMLYIAVAIFILGNVIAALSDSYLMLAVGRVVSAVGAASYTPNASIAAATMAGEKNRGRALALVLGGLTVANVLGVPLGTYLGDHTGYRGVFWLVTVLGVLAFLGLLTLPPIPNPPAVGLRTRLGMLRTPGVPTTLVISLFGCLGGFTVGTYLVPVLTQTIHPGSGTITLVFFVFGLAGAIGNILGGQLTDRWGAYPTAMLSFSTFWIVLALAPWTFSTLTGALLTVAVWGVFGWLMMPPQQHRLMGLAPTAAPLLISLNASAMYLGIGGGGLVGGLIVRFGDVRAVPLAGAAAGLIAFVLFLLTVHRPAPETEPMVPAVSALPEPSDTGYRPV